MLRLLTLVMATLLLSLPSLAQTASSSDTTTPPATLHLPAGKQIKDSKGRVIENGGGNENGSLHVTYSGKLKRDDNGNYTCTGEVTKVTNPASQGTEGPINVNTNNEPTDVDLPRNGTDPGGHVVTNVSGNKGNVSVGGNYNDVNITGNNNTLTITGNHNTGNINGQNNNVNMGGHGNTVTSGGTTVRN